MRQVILLLASLSIGNACFGGDRPKTPELDRFGGWKGKRFETTGYFRAEHDGDRWWLVTPEGNAFLSLGINHYHPEWWAQDYNREHWVNEFGAERPWVQAWHLGFRDRAVADCQRMGLRTLGFHSEAPMLIEPPLGPVMPYIRQYEPVRFSSWRRPKPEAYVDIFSSDFENQCDAVARQLVRPYANDPMILGFAMADVPILADKDSRRSKGTTWPRVLRNLGADAPGKQAYVATMRQRHGDIRKLNSAYGTQFSSWDALAAAQNWRIETDFANQAELADNMQFMRRCVDQYYTVAKAAFRRYDSNHMFLGDKLNGNGDSLDDVVDITGRHTDLILFQCYGRWDYQKPRYDLWSSKTDKPLLNGDSSYGVAGEMMPNPLGNPHCQARDQSERAEWTQEFAESAFARSDFVGWHICGIIDTWKTMPGKEQWQHCGLMTPTGEFYPEMERTIQDLSSRLYEIATSDRVTYFVDSRNGSDRHDGLSPDTAWQSLARVNRHHFSPGDSIRFKSGERFLGTLKPGCSGTIGHPITVGKYGGDVKPIIDGQDRMACVHLVDVECWELADLELVNEGGDDSDAGAERYRAGVRAEVHSAGTIRGIALRNLKIHRIYPNKKRMSERFGSTFYEGYGVHFYAAGTPTGMGFAGVMIEGCEISDVAGDGIWFSRQGWDQRDPKYNFLNVVIRNNRLRDIGGAGLVPMRCENLLVEGNVISHTGASTDPRQFGMGSGMYAWRSTEVLVQRNRFEHARGWYDSAGAHIDLGNSNLVYQHNISHDNAGGFIYVFGDCRNAVFRHNVSINDGRRVKGTPNPHNNTPNDAARTIWISDYNGQDREPTGSHHIDIHNNTIYVGPDIEPIVRIDPRTHGNFIRNNIFYVDGRVTCQAHGDSTFDDNLYWGPGQKISGLPIGPMALFADPRLVNPGDVDPDGYKLTEDSPAINAGAEIADPGTFDFWGDELSRTRPLDIGADEYAVEINNERMAQIATASEERRKQRASQPAEVARQPRNPQPTRDDAQFNAWVAPFLQQLNLTDEQRPKFLAVQKQMTQKWAEFQRMNPQERQAKQAAYYQARHAELAELLTRAQMAKYLEIRAARSGQSLPRKPDPTQEKTDAPLPSTRPDYSGKDIHGIESIVKEAEGGADSWRQAAEKRIDQLRKANLVLQIVDEQGKPLSGVPVRIKQTRHLFRFGGIVGGQSMHEPASGQKPRRISPDRYKEMFLELGFNTAGFNKYLKYKQRPRSAPHLPALFAWFQEHDIPVRGHCLMWPGGVWMNFMPPELSELVYVHDPSIDWSSHKKRVSRENLTAPEKQAVRELCKKIVEEASRQWPVFEWDVINETRDNHVVQDLVGKDVIVDWFRFARQNTVDKDAGLYLNEYRVISDPLSEVITPNMKRYEEEIRYLLENGAAISGIGFQSRFHAKTPPETIYERLCYFEQFNLPYAATEFEMNDTVGGEFERAAMTERAMMVLFSHRLVNGIYAWSLLAQDQGGPGHRAILEDDGRLKLRGKVWMYLMKNRWWTDESMTTDANGTVRLRGFKGHYEVTVGKNAAASSTQISLTNNADIEVRAKALP